MLRSSPHDASVRPDRSLELAGPSLRSGSTRTEEARAGSVGVRCAVQAITRWMFPCVLFDPPAIFRAERSDAFASGVVDERSRKNERGWIVRKEDGSFNARLTICTHRGFAPDWLAAENRFRCPCRGSGFTRDGITFADPAPRPLDRGTGARTPESILGVDKSLLFRVAPKPSIQRAW